MEVPAASATVISVRGLRMGYGAHILLENASFDVRRGEILVILGGSGSGKSRLMKNMIGLYRPMAGDISIAGKSIVKASPAEKAALQRSLGVMYQSGALFGSLTVLENVRFPLDQFTDLGLAEKNLTARLLLRQVEMGYAESLMPAELSGGMLKRSLCMACWVGSSSLTGRNVSSPTCSTSQPSPIPAAANRLSNSEVKCKPAVGAAADPALSAYTV